MIKIVDTLNEAKFSNNTGVSKLEVLELGSSVFVRSYSGEASKYPPSRKFTDIRGSHWIQKEVGSNNSFYFSPSPMVNGINFFIADTYEQANTLRNTFMAAHPEEYQKYKDDGLLLVAIAWTSAETHKHVTSYENLIHIGLGKYTWVDTFNHANDTNTGIPIYMQFSDTTIELATAKRDEYFTGNPDLLQVGTRVQIKSNDDALIETYDGHGWVAHKPQHKTHETASVVYGIDGYGDFKRVDEIPDTHIFVSANWGTARDLRGQYFIDHPTEKIPGVRVILSKHDGLEEELRTISTWDGVSWVDTSPTPDFLDDKAHFVMDSYGHWHQIL